MNHFRKVFDSIFKIAFLPVSYRQIWAVLLLFAIVMPIAVPVPVWAYSLNLPPVLEEDFSIPSFSTIDFIEELFSVGDEKKKRRERGGKRTSEDVSKPPSGPETPTDEKEPVRHPEPPARPPRRSAMPAAPLASQLPLGEIDALFTPQNNLGTPKGQTEPSAKVEAAAARSRERAGIGSFSFDIPVASLPGRGMDASIGITYNSRMWTKSGTNNFTYDVESSWLAAGFNMSLGYLELQYTSGQSPVPRILTDPNGTRHQLFSVGSGNYETADGTFIHVSGHTATFPDGTKIRYWTDFASGTLQRHYPTAITDRNGNFIQTAYDSDLSGRLSYIRDTLGRYIRFHYENNSDKKLVAVTVPTHLAGPNSLTRTLP